MTFDSPAARRMDATRHRTSAREPLQRHDLQQPRQLLGDVGADLKDWAAR